MIERFMARLLDLFVFAVLAMFGLSLAAGLLRNGCASVSRGAGSAASSAGIGLGVVVGVALLCVFIGVIARLGHRANDVLGPGQDRGRARGVPRYRAEDVPQTWAAADIDDDPAFRI